MSNASPPADWQIQNNRDVIRRLVNDPEISQSSDEPGDLHYNYLPNDEPDDLQYYVQPNGENELELLGRLVGMNTDLKLTLIGGPTTQLNGEPVLSINPFLTGLFKSITKIELYFNEEGQMMRCHTTLFKSSRAIDIRLNAIVINSNQRSVLLSAIMRYKKLCSLKLQQWQGQGIYIGEEEIDVLVAGLPNSNLLSLEVSGINGSVKGVDALAAALPS